MEDTGGGKDGAQVSPRSRTLAREGVLFRGGKLPHTPTVGGEVDSGCSELKGVESCHPVLPRQCELTPSRLPEHQLSQPGTAGSVRLPGS